MIIKPCPDNIQDLYLASLEHLGIDLAKHDVRFVEDDWESPTLGAWGLGWEVWIDGMEATQFTYFQQVGGIDLDPPSVELTYGTERLAMYLQGVDSVFDLEWALGPGASPTVTSTRRTSPVSVYNFDLADTRAAAVVLRLRARMREAPGPRAGPAGLRLRAQSHTFNLLDARGAISVTERTGYIARVRNLARKVAGLYLEVFGRGGEDAEAGEAQTAGEEAGA